MNLLFFKIKKNIIIIILLIATLFFTQFINQKPKSQINIDVVSYGDIEKSILASGTLKPSEQVNVGAQVNGQLKKLYVKEGDSVKQGQLLAEIDPTLQQNEVNKAKAELENVLAQKKIAQLNLTQARRELNRQKKMALDGAAVKSELENAQTQYEINLAQFHTTEIQISQSQLAMETAEANLAFTKITAPIDGEVLKIHTTEGQTIVSSQVAPTIMILANLEKMSVHTRISETDILKVKPNQPLWFYIIAAPEERYESQLRAIQQAPDDMLQDSAANTASSPSTSAVYYNGIFDIDNSNRRLKSAMTAQVFIMTEQAKNVLKVPVSALKKHPNKNEYYVYLKDGDEYKKQIVKVGINNNEYAEIIAGLNAGDSIVLDSYDYDK